MRRLLLAAALAGAATFAPATADAYFCAAYVGDLCVGPCGPVNAAGRIVFGNEIMYC